jgi:hypothetical protein
MGKNIVRLTTNHGHATMTHTGESYAAVTVEVPDDEMAELKQQANFHDVTMSIIAKS